MYPVPDCRGSYRLTTSFDDIPSTRDVARCIISEATVRERKDPELIPFEQLRKAS